ncbi:unnamed protein product [Rotaria socialis]|uniref:BED-type domain-containing protein n=1 Tax=Rotaria socialis TaxID=392032 RepID=A0A817TYG9_9BILA|nr:unnamed protein product [Rotaria socialis]CAF4688444.1 unnamed protein product [Rotaria socialis]
MNEDDQGNDNDHQNTITSNNVNSEEGQRRQRSDSTASNTTEVTKCEKEIKKTTTMTKEDVLSHFTTIDGNMKCKLCKNAHNVFKANYSSDTNLRRHLAYVHNLNQFLYPSQLQNRKKASLISTKLKQQLDKAAIDAISVDGRSFGDLGKEGITKFLNLSNPGYRVSNRKTMIRQLELSYKNYRKELKKQMTYISNISLTCDVWKSSTRAYYICITGHFYNEKSQLESYILCFRRFLGSHTAVRLRRFLFNEIQKLGIHEKMTSITTDNSKDICIAASTVGFGNLFSCL